MKKVGVTEAKAHLSALMARAGYGGERFLIERRGRPLAALVGVEDLERLEGERGDNPSRPLGAIALVGAWGEAEERDLDAVLAEIYAERRRDTDILGNLMKRAPSSALVGSRAMPAVVCTTS